MTRLAVPVKSGTTEEWFEFLDFKFELLGGIIVGFLAIAEGYFPRGCEERRCDADSEWGRLD